MGKPKKRERKLKNRRRYAGKGRAIRISMTVYDALNEQRKDRSWDAFFRAVFGLPDRKGYANTCAEGMLETTTGMFLLKMPGTSWDKLEETAYKLAHKMAEKKRTGKVSYPLRMREVL